MIETTFSVSLKDALVVSWFSATRTVPLILFHLIFPLAGILLFCAELFIKGSVSFSVAMITIFAIFFTPLLSGLIYYSLKRRNPAALRQVYHFDEKHIRQIGENLSIDMQWELFDKIKETQNYFLTFPKNKTGNVGAIPKRSLSEQDTVKLRELFTRKVNANSG